MGIAFTSENHYPTTENGAAADATTVTLVASSWSAPGVSLGDLVLVLVEFRGGGGGSASTSVTTTGGQSWTEEFDVSTAGWVGGAALYRCIFNGTWSADPVFTNTGIADTPTLWAVALSGFDAASPWDVSPSASQDGDPAYDLANYSTNTNGAWAFVGFGCTPKDTATVDSSFVAPSGSGNVYWRAGGATGAASGFARKEITTAGAVGTTTFALTGSRDGIKWSGAVKAGGVIPQDAMSFLGGVGTA